MADHLSKCDVYPCGRFSLNNLLRCSSIIPLSVMLVKIVLCFRNLAKTLHVILFAMNYITETPGWLYSSHVLFSALSPDAVPLFYVEGGLLFGGGGSFIPSRKSSPVSLRFHATTTLWFKGWTNAIAPVRLHSWTQHPQYQHSSGYSTIGGMFLVGFGIKTSARHASTHALHPLHIVESNSIASFGVGGFGTI